MPSNSNAAQGHPKKSIIRPRAYVYFLGWPKQQQYYIGFRFANKVPPKEDLWIHYFTSSKSVAYFRKLYGDPDVVEVLREFYTPEAAYYFESKLLRFLRVRRNPYWLNKWDNCDKRGRVIPFPYKLKHRRPRRPNRDPKLSKALIKRLQKLLIFS